MKVGFGCTVLARGLCHSGVDGIGAYTRELGNRLSTDNAINLIPVAFNASIGDDFPFPRESARRFPSYVAMAALAAISPFSFPSASLENKVDLFHATDHLIPRFRHIPVVATLMDAIPLVRPEWARTHFVRQKNWLWRQAAQWADHVLTISEYSRRDIARYFGVGLEKISIVPLGVDTRYFERIGSEIKREIINRLGVPSTFYLFVGTLQPRKNIERVLDAHAALPLHLQKEVPLVVVGRAGWGCEGLVARLNDEAQHGRVRWLKYLSDVDVRALMQTAQALVFPSLYEGFGLPVVEAFASGLPVITSNTTALPEVALDAALLVNPLDVGEISDAMRQVVEVSGLSEQLVVAGQCRAQELTWSACAKKTLAVYQNILS